MSQGIQYRPEIDGLRAIAVLAVLFFHAKLGFLPGGFVGVDIFFVISGYLIASIILNDEKQGNFGILKFYERRTRRIFPALFVVVLFSLIVGWFRFTPRDFEQLGWAAFASMAFFSNLYFAKPVGYFAPSSDTLPLLHTWSLGVEEQFYLIAPLVLLLVNRKFFQYRIIIFAILFLASLITSIHGVFIGSKRIFFMPHVRACELLIGVMLAMNFFPRFKTEGMKDAGAALGLLMIVCSFFLIDAESPFPGALALLPTVGTGLLIHAMLGSQGIIARFLSSRPVVGVGKISYSLYLWHWPLLAFAEYEYESSLENYHRVGLLLLAVGLSILTYRYVEQPARHRTQWVGRNSVFALGTAAIAVCGLACWIIQQTNGLPQRLPLEAQKIASYLQSPDRNEICSVATRIRLQKQPEICQLGLLPLKTPQFILWGDSHAGAIAPLINKLVVAEGMQGLNLFNNGCPGIFGLQNYAKTFRPCLTFSALSEKYIQDTNITDVIMASYWVFYTEGTPPVKGVLRNSRRFVPGDIEANRAAFEKNFLETIDKLLAAGKRITIIGPTPEMPVDVSSAIIKSAMRHSFKDISVERASFEAREKVILRIFKEVEQRKGVHIIYPHQKLCDSNLCYGAKDRVPLYSDTNHLTDFGTMKFAPELIEALKRMRNPH